jgi:molecular chaperone DnaJ
MAERDYYEVLGVSRGATLEEIRQACLDLVRRHHPDRNPSDPDAERTVNELSRAYEVLSNPVKRSLYDQYGHAGPPR